jgi:hypothetical protein
MKPRTRITAVILTLALALSIVSAQADASFSGELSAKAEAQTMGGSCAMRWGIFVGLAVGTFSACSVLCATGAWFAMMTLNRC